jgi:regulatory protein
MSESVFLKSVLSKAMAQCSRREYCKSDIINKLLAWGVAENDTEMIINTLCEDNFINESRYASAYVSDKFKYNKWGKIKISAYLKAKNISSEIITEALGSIDNKAYHDLIKILITSRRKSIKSKNQYDLKARLIRYGLSKGFESDLLYDILNKLED